ncbi:hypothetical protein [Candidatus Albibeggiatoa sp. nov. NOAA]|uniref:hypothetical protein n=1 Tax=Candidatus Albibeggiatoa sp. nov. NOAA TaxID=3162724 RepID=UPI0032F3D7AF|nr:hypothetical protein [Thiotrichaceae bacterium]
MTPEQIEALMQRVKAQEQHIHKPYSETMGKPADFEVEYELAIDPALGQIIPSQAMRCDFAYASDRGKNNHVYMIYPELLDTDGNIILDKRIRAADKGKATMWIILPESRPTHCQRIKVGTQGHWVVGSKILANVTVTKIIGLFINTT